MLRESPRRPAEHRRRGRQRKSAEASLGVLRHRRRRPPGLRRSRTGKSGSAWGAVCEPLSGALFGTDRRESHRPAESKSPGFQPVERARLGRLSAFALSTRAWAGTRDWPDRPRSTERAPSGRRRCGQGERQGSAKRMTPAEESMARVTRPLMCRRSLGLDSGAVKPHAWSP